MSIEELNKKFKHEFENNKDYAHFEKYVMSELLSPIQDYVNTVKLIGENLNILKNLDLLMIAAYLNSEYHYMLGENRFLKILDEKVKSANNEDCSIIYYLLAYDLICKNKNWRNNDECVRYLQQSVSLSKNFKFVNNRYYLVQSLNYETKGLIKEVFENFVSVETEKDLKRKDISYWLSPKQFIDEFILGTVITDVAYQQKRQTLLALQ